MPVDPKAAKHVCNVIRRQVEQTYPDLHIHFLVHNENQRADEFVRDFSTFEEDHCTLAIESFFENVDNAYLLSQNRSDFLVLARYNNPGVMGFFKNESAFALCAVNCDRFTSDQTVRNHAHHLAWYAIDIYERIHNDESLPSDKKNYGKAVIYTKDSCTMPIAQQHLSADIFSACMQYFNGKESALQDLLKQRLTNTLSNEVGFIAENFPYPAAYDSLSSILQNNMKQYKKSRSPLKAARALTAHFVSSLEESIIEQWKNFSIPCQRLAWAGYTPATILGAALFTSENTHTQSIADMVSEKMAIKPETMNTLPYENPFGENEANKKLHEKLCLASINNVFSSIYSVDGYPLIYKAAFKQSELLAEGKTAGWCVPALLDAAQTFQTAETSESLEIIKERALAKAQKAIQEISWQSLDSFACAIFLERRLKGDLSLEHIRQIASHSDGFLNIYSGIVSLEAKQEELLKNSKSGILQFVSPKNIT